MLKLLIMLVIFAIPGFAFAQQQQQQQIVPLGDRMYMIAREVDAQNEMLRREIATRQANEAELAKWWAAYVQGLPGPK